MSANLARVRERIARACSRVGRQPGEVTLVAVTKTRSPEEIIQAYQCGVRHLGENRVEEAEVKIPALASAFQADPPTWHMIGHVQSRKAERAVAIADVIHSVDSLRLARRLDRFAGELGKRMPVLLELNVSGEESKEGFPSWDDAGREALLVQIPELIACEHLSLRGLMTMAPIVPDPEQARPVFQALRRIRDTLRERFDALDWPELSMGMTDDFEVAIEEGATLVRIGRAIFGPRDY
ncbi:MAG: YggS family pyridoxal phosphate-dependent enzyme [Chloroflexi bacterium]|nr:YggS family pyridoxal phosphate-dependent enzyme [Chloroflexota bacterium]